MAVKKEVIQEEEIQAVEPAVVPEYDPWQDMRTITIPKAPRGEQQYLLIGVNGSFTQVPRGTPQTIPAPVYERITILLDAEQKEYEYLKSIDGIDTNISTGEKTAIRR